MKKYKGLGVVAFTITCMLGLSACGTEHDPEQGQDTTEESATGDGGDEEDFDDEETDGIDEDNDGVIEDDEGETNAGDESDTVDSEESEDPVDDSVSNPDTGSGTGDASGDMGVQFRPMRPSSHGQSVTDTPRAKKDIPTMQSRPKTVALRSSVRPVSKRAAASATPCIFS